MKVLVTGGAGFIGSAVCRLLVGELGMTVLNVDKLTYAANLASLKPIENDRRYAFHRADIADRPAIAALLRSFAPDAILHLAAETHVDRSIDGPGEFIKTNIEGTYVLLEAALEYWRALPAERAKRFRFHHVSTDEVFGSLGPDGKFSEVSRYQPNSPYAASKAAADHLVRAWHETFGLPTVISNCSNNYGPYHFPEKLIPLAILKALAGEPVPVYGTGDNIRDWLYVEDHARALHAVLTGGRAGRELQYRRRWRAHQPRGRDRDLRAARRASAQVAASAACAPDHALSPTGPATTGAMRWMRQRSAASSAGSRAKASRPACARPSRGISTTAGGGSRSGPSATAAPGSAPAGRARRRAGRWVSDEGDRPRRRVGHAALPGDARHQQAAAAGL